MDQLHGAPGTAALLPSQLMWMHFGSLLAAVILCGFSAPWQVVAEAVGTTPVVALAVRQKAAAEVPESKRAE